MKRVTIIGSTGSIGQTSLEVLSHLRDRFSIFALSAYRNIDRLALQIKKFEPSYAVVADSNQCLKLKGMVSKTKVLCGEEGLLEISSHPDTDIVIVATSNYRGVFPTLAGIKARKRVALATKEVLVCFGEVVMRELKRYDGELLPIDSEHSAIHQCIYKREKRDIKRIILTASGGPFLYEKNFKEITVDKALSHPVWRMGKKITIDSATLMNKGLEVIEAKWLFDIEPKNIDVVIHPQSIIHSMVEFVDGSLLAQLSLPDMKLAVQYALTFPLRLPSLLKPLDLPQIKELRFLRPDREKFPCLELAYSAIREGGSYPAVLNGADQKAVELFLQGVIGFTQIPELIKRVLDTHKPILRPSLEELIEAVKWAYNQTQELIR